MLNDVLRGAGVAEYRYGKSNIHLEYLASYIYKWNEVHNGRT